MENNKDLNLNHVFDLIGSGKITEIEAERLINAAARLENHIPTVASQVTKTKHS